MSNPIYSGSFKFPSSTRSIGARKGGLFSRGNKHQAQIYNFYKRNNNSGMGSADCGSGYCMNDILGCLPCYY